MSVAPKDGQHSTHAHACTSAAAAMASSRSYSSVSHAGARSGGGGDELRESPSDHCSTNGGNGSSMPSCVVQGGGSCSHSGGAGSQQLSNVLETDARFNELEGKAVQVDEPVALLQDPA